MSDKPREFWIKPAHSPYEEDNILFCKTTSKEYEHVIENSAYTTLQSELAEVRAELKHKSEVAQVWFEKHLKTESELSAEREAASKLIEALEFIAMPLTKDTHTVQGLLDTVRTDTNKAIKALSEYKKARGENE